MRPQSPNQQQAVAFRTIAPGLFKFSSIAAAALFDRFSQVRRCKK